MKSQFECHFNFRHILGLIFLLISPLCPERIVRYGSKNSNSLNSLLECGREFKNSQNGFFYKLWKCNLGAILFLISLQYSQRIAVYDSKNTSMVPQDSLVPKVDNFSNVFIQPGFWEILVKFTWITEKILWKVIENFTKILKKLCENFEKILRKYWEMFTKFMRKGDKILWKFEENLQKFCKSFAKISNEKFGCNL